MPAIARHEMTRAEPKAGHGPIGRIGLIARASRIALTSAPMAAMVPVDRRQPAVPIGRRADPPRPAAPTSRPSPSSGVRRNPLAGGTPRTIGPRGNPTGRVVLTAREVRIADRATVIATIGRIGPAPTATDRNAGVAIGRTGRPVPTAANGRMATVLAPRTRTVTARTVVGATGAPPATRARTGADQARSGIARVLRALTEAVPIPIVAARPVRVVTIRIVVGRDRIGIARVVRPVVGRRRIGTVRGGKVRTAVSQVPIVIVPRTTGVVTSEIDRRMVLLTTIAHAQTAIVPTVPARIAIPPTGRVRVAKAPIGTGLQVLVPPAVAALPTGMSAAIAPIAAARNTNGPSGRAAAGHPASEHHEPTGIRVRALRTDRSGDRGSGTIARAGTRTHPAAPRIAATGRPATPTDRTRTDRTRTDRGTGPTNEAGRAQTAVVRPMIAPGARRVIDRGVTTAGTTDRAETTVTRAVPIITNTTGRPAREWTSVSART